MKKGYRDVGRYIYFMIDAIPGLMDTPNWDIIKLLEVSMMSNQGKRYNKEFRPETVQLVLGSWKKRF